MPWTLSAIGLHPFGFATPTAAAVPPQSVGSLSRFINAASGSYEIDPITGQFIAMPPLRQRFLLALLMKKGSMPGDPEFGLQLPTTMGNGFERDVELAIRLACRHLTDVEKVARIDAVDTKRTGTGRADIIVRYTDLKNGIPDDVSI